MSDGLVHLSLREALADIERLTRERNAARREAGRLRLVLTGLRDGCDDSRCGHAVCCAIRLGEDERAAALAFAEENGIEVAFTRDDLQAWADGLDELHMAYVQQIALDYHRAGMTAACELAGHVAREHADQQRSGQSRGARSVVDVISQVLRGEQASL